MFQTYSTINVMLEDQNGTRVNLERQVVMVNGEGNIYFAPMLNSLAQSHDQIQNSDIMIFDEKSSQFFNIGRYPFHDEICIQRTFEYLHFKIYQNCAAPSEIPVYKTETVTPFNASRVMQETDTNGNESTSEPVAQGNSQKRSSEKYIYEVEEALIRWRKLIDDQQLNLNEAAEIIGWPRKSLDDYYMKFKQGNTMGFDFEQFKTCQMGVLRKFVNNNGIDETYKIAKPNTNEINIENSDYISFAAPNTQNVSLLIENSKRETQNKEERIETDRLSEQGMFFEPFSQIIRTNSLGDYEFKNNICDQNQIQNIENYDLREDVFDFEEEYYDYNNENEANGQFLPLFYKKPTSLNASFEEPNFNNQNNF